MDYESGCTGAGFASDQTVNLTAAFRIPAATDGMQAGSPLHPRTAAFSSATSVSAVRGVSLCPPFPDKFVAPLGLSLEDGHIAHR